MPFSLKGRRSILFLAVLLFVHLVLISIQVPLENETSLFKRAIFTVFAPVQRNVVSAIDGIAGTWNGFFGLRGVRTENQRLKKELFFRNQENGILRGLGGFLRNANKLEEKLQGLRGSILAARIIGLDASNYYRSVIVNRGRADGVRKDMAVCDRNGNVIGRTVDPVTQGESRVQLITDADSGISVISSGPDRIVGVLSGDSLGLCRMKFVLATTAGGAEGEELFTTGFDKIYPPGLRVGTVVQVGNDASLFKAILVRPAFSFADLDAVAIITEQVQELY